MTRIFLLETTGKDRFAYAGIVLFNHLKDLNPTVVRVCDENFSLVVNAHLGWVIQAALFPAHSRLPAYEGTILPEDYNASAISVYQVNAAPVICGQTGRKSRIFF